MAKKNEGKLFEEDIQTSCKEQDIWFHRIRDAHIPFQFRGKIQVPENPYDCLIFKDGYLFPTELKSIDAKSMPMNEGMIKSHQIEALRGDMNKTGILPGFLFNFRPVESTYFVPIEEFLRYQQVAKGEIKSMYTAKTNKASMPFAICEEVGFKVRSVKKRVKYRHYIGELLDDIILHKRRYLK